MTDLQRDNFSATPSIAEQLEGLPSRLAVQLWAKVAEQLEKGEALISNQHFEAVIAREYQELVEEEPSKRVLKQIRRMVLAVNSAHPETFLAQGMQNGVKKAFEKGARKLKWDVAKIQAKGNSTLRRFKGRDEVADLFEEVNLRPDKIDLLHCIVGTIRELEGVKGEKDGTHAKDADREVSTWDATEFPEDVSGMSLEESTFAAEDGGGRQNAGQGSKEVLAELEEAVLGGEVEREEIAERTRQQEVRRYKIEVEEYERVPKNLPGLVESGAISTEEAEKVKELHEVEMRLSKGEIDKKEASRIRNSILDTKVRDELDRKVKEVVDQSVRYLHAFESMQNISPEYDEALTFLIQHKELVVASKDSGVDPTAVLRGLMEDEPLLEKVIAIMERQDQELRMLSVRLPPYNAIMKRGLEKIGNMTIDESFVGDLRALTQEDMSERLNSPKAEVRVRPAGDMRCLISLIDHLIKPTRFRKEIRLLRVTQQLEEFFRSTSDLKEARHQAESFLERRLRRLFPDISTEETSEIRQRGAQMIDDIEQKIRDERREEIEEKRHFGQQEQSGKKGESGGGEDELELTEEEKKKGVTIGRVEMRVAGTQRRIPNKIMPDPDDESRFVIATRDADTGEVSPQMRRGAKRYVERGKDGFWGLV
jgi:hypothetical protein